MTLNVDLDKHLRWVINAHQRFANSKKAAVRFWDGKTPYSIHPLWCGFTMLAETNLPNKFRQDGALALFYHDVLEDTRKRLPSNLSKKTKYLVKEMTFQGGIEEEKREIWNKDTEVILLKLYDKTSTLLDAVWMSEKDLKSYKAYTRKLLSRVEKDYKNLNIVKIAKAVLGGR